MPDESPEIDWDNVRKASLNLAEILWSYHQSLISCGFNEKAALQLTVAYQASWLSNANL